jgi:hypothetical protein
MATGRALIQIKPHFIWLRHGCDCRESDALGQIRFALDILGPVVRSHWAIENSLHWVMDMVFRDDECRVRTDHAPAGIDKLTP